MMERLHWELSRASKMFIKNPPIVVAIPLGGLLFAFARQAVSVYMDMLIPLLLVTMISWFLTGLANGNDRIITYVMILLMVGTMLQCVFIEEAILANPNKTFVHPTLGLQVQYGIAFCVACVGGFFYRNYPKLSSLKWCKGYIIASILIPIITLMFATAIGGVKNWIKIGGFSIQTTEIVKFLYIFIASALLGTKEEVSKRRLVVFYGVTAVDLFFLAVQSEFGTLLLILLIFLVYLFLFGPDMKSFFKTTGVLAVFITIVMSFCFVLSRFREAGNFFGTNPMARVILHNYDKIANRFIFWLDPYKDATGLGYQLIQAKNSILLGGWLGTTAVNNRLPVKTSDLVYPALIQRCGILFGLIVFVIFILLWLEGILVMVRKKERYHCAMAAGITFMLFFQALIIIGGSTGICPLTGITLPFISSGGSSLMISAVMIGLLLAISGNVSWKGNNVDEEAFFKEGPVVAKCHAYLRNLYADCISSCVGGDSGNRSGGRSGKRCSKRRILSRKLHEGKHSR